MAAALGSTDNAGLSSPAEAVADAIVHAATAARPRTRCPVGSSARALLLLRRLLPDRVFDGFWTIYKSFLR